MGNPTTQWIGPNTSGSLIGIPTVFAGKNYDPQIVAMIAQRINHLHIDEDVLDLAGSTSFCDVVELIDAFPAVTASCRPDQVRLVNAIKERLAAVDSGTKIYINIVLKLSDVVDVMSALDPRSDSITIELHSKHIISSRFSAFVESNANDLDDIEVIE